MASNMDQDYGKVPKAIHMQVNGNLEEQMDMEFMNGSTAIDMKENLKNA